MFNESNLPHVLAICATVILLVIIVSSTVEGVKTVTKHTDIRESYPRI